MLICIDNSTTTLFAGIVSAHKVYSPAHADRSMKQNNVGAVFVLSPEDSFGDEAEAGPWA